MIRKTAKDMKKKNKKTKPSSEKRNRKYSWYIFSRNTNITHSDYCVIKSWRLPPKCLSGNPKPYLVEIDGKYIWSTRFQLSYKKEASTPYQYQYDAYNVSVLVTGYCTPAFASYIWTRRESSNFLENFDIIEPYDSSQYMQFCQIVEFKGRFYAMSLQGSVVVIEKEKVDSDRFGITRIGGNRAVPSKACRQFREYHVKSHEEILVVFLISRKSIYVEAFVGAILVFLDDKGCVKFGACEGWFSTHILPHLDVKIETH